MMPQLVHAINAAHAANMQGDFLSAVKWCRQVLAIAPGIPEAWYNLGIAEANLGHRDAALDALKQARFRTLDSPEAQNSIGLQLIELRAYAEAESCLERAIALAPKYVFAHANLGKLRQQQKRLDEAEKHISIAIQQEPGLASLYTNLGSILFLKKLYPAAKESCLKAIELDPKLPQAWINLGNILIAQDQLEAAETVCLKAVELGPQLPEVWGTLGKLYFKQNHAEAAETACRKDVELSPNSPAAWGLLGEVLTKKKQIQQAAECFQKAYELDPDHDYILSSLLYSNIQICDWSQLSRTLPNLYLKIEQNCKVSAFGILGLITDPALQRRAAEIYAADQHPSIRLLPPITDKTSKSQQDGSDRKIRVGYFSADFRLHPVSLLSVELFEKHDKSKFELIAFSFSLEEPDQIQNRISKAFDTFIDVSSMRDVEITKLSRELGIDIAVDLGGFTAGSRPGVFAMRAAPIQVSYLGYPGTMGGEYMDYLLTDKTVCPEGSQPHYAEKMAYLPHCFMPHDSTQEISLKLFTRQEFSLSESSFVFCCFNNHYKINPRVFDVWMRLLQKVPGSVLWLSDGNQGAKDNLRKEATARGIDSSRIVFARRLESMAEHLARYRLADLFIDTLPYNAHTTACDALWAGVPVLTCTGESFASRVAASQLNAIGLPELVTSTLAEYEALALELVTNPSKLAAIRQKLSANRLSTPLFDTPRLAKDIEQIYRAMYERHLDGLPPEHIHL